VLFSRHSSHSSPKGGKKVFQANGHHKYTGVAILISEKVDFRLKSIKEAMKVTS
jgi:hypothetical protein